MASADEPMVVLCEWQVEVYVPADLPLDAASALAEVAESQLGVSAAGLELFLRRRLPTLRVEVR